MPVQATVFSRVLQHVPWGVFDRVVRSQRTDKGHRTLSARSHLAALLAGQLIEARGLRDIEAVMASHAPALSRRAIEPICRSTLADANAKRSPAAFEALIPALLARLSPTKARLAREDLRLLDSTLLRPGAQAAAWARFQCGQVAAKLHVVFDPQAAVPTFFELTSGNINDITVAKKHMLLAAGATYVFDLGYYDYGLWADLDARGCRFVTRLKKNTEPTVLEERPVEPNTNVTGDRVVTLPPRQARSRKNPFGKPGRAVGVRLETGRHITLFTNDLESPAGEIAELYKTRWQIELFFRWIKQNLRIRSFLGRSYNAVRLQIAAAIITYLLLTLMHRASQTNKSLSAFCAVLRAALFTRFELRTLLKRSEMPRTRQKNLPTQQLSFQI